MKLLFDTSIIIDALRLDKEAVAVIKQFEQKDEIIYLPSIVGLELFSGDSSRNPSQVKKINEFLNFFQIVDLTWEISCKAGEIYRSGIKNLQIPDYIIAATALKIDAQVVTLNKKHFSQIPNLLIYPL